MSLLLLELNEINFDVVSKYMADGTPLPGFAALFRQGLQETTSESAYEMLEPWIQWPSVHTGKQYDDHKVFRLGDIVDFPGEQIFETVEEMGFSVGAISPMNADNRMKAPAFFIPDPWTNAESDKSFVSMLLTPALRQAVNDNSQARITVASTLRLMIVFIICVRKSRWLQFFQYAIAALGKPWRKALFLDMLLHEVHLWMLKRKKPDFSTLFLNAGAHIQHHYFLNSVHAGVDAEKNPDWYLSSSEDPILEMLLVYDRILHEIFAQSSDVIVATGLSQQPFLKPVYYYRLKNHSAFLNAIGVQHLKVEPRMTRDFLVTFVDERSAELACNQLRALSVGNDIPLFETLDRRGAEVFATLTYPHEIKSDTLINHPSGPINLSEWVVFVAIKNGAHDARGFCAFSPEMPVNKIESGSHVASLFFVIKEYFSLKQRRGLAGTS